LTNASGVPWTSAYVNNTGDLPADLLSNIAAEQRLQQRLSNGKLPKPRLPSNPTKTLQTPRPTRNNKRYVAICLK